MLGSLAAVRRDRCVGGVSRIALVSALALTRKIERDKSRCG